MTILDVVGFSAPPCIILLTQALSMQITEQQDKMQTLLMCHLDNTKVQKFMEIHMKHEITEIYLKRIVNTEKLPLPTK